MIDNEWELEIPKLYKSMRKRSKILFEGLDEFAEEVLLSGSDGMKGVKTKPSKSY